MVRKIKLFVEANNFPLKIVRSYFRYSTKSELFFDFVIPFVISIAVIILIFEHSSNLKIFLDGVNSINTHSLTSISILAGFNIASISVLATSGSKLLEQLKVTYSESYPKVTLFEIMLTFFCAAIVIQFFIILLDILILIILSVVSYDHLYSSVVGCEYWVLLFLWIYIIIVSIFVSLRNLKTLFVILVYQEHRSNKSKQK